MIYKVNYIINYFASKQRPDTKVEPYIKHCCNKKLKMLQGRNITVFNINDSYRSTMVNGYCEKCQKKYSHNYFIEKGEKYVTCNSILNDNLIYFAGDYAYEKDLIQWLSNCILYLYSGFENFTNCYNATNNSYCSNADYYNIKMSSTRIQDFWFLYQFIIISLFYTTKQKLNIPNRW